MGQNPSARKANSR